MEKLVVTESQLLLSFLIYCGFEMNFNIIFIRTARNKLNGYQSPYNNVKPAIS